MADLLQDLADLCLQLHQLHRLGLQDLLVLLVRPLQLWRNKLTEVKYLPLGCEVQNEVLIAPLLVPPSLCSLLLLWASSSLASC